MERKDNFWIVEIEGVSFNIKIDGGLSDPKESRRRTGNKRKVSREDILINSEKSFPSISH